MYKQELLLLLFSKDVVCVLDKGSTEPVCKEVESKVNTVDNVKENVVPIHDPYIPRLKEVIYNCTNAECKQLELNSITQITSPNLNLRLCYPQAKDTYKCDKMRYNYWKNVDKLLFLTKTIPNKTYFLVDCLVYASGERVCHTKNTNDSHTKLMDTGNIVKPKELAVLSQDEFICEQNQGGEVICDLNPYIPLKGGLVVKDTPKIVPNILLKAGTYVVILKLKCDESWCGYRGHTSKTRRAAYKPPGGDVYRCYYAKGQQICKRLYNQYDDVEAIIQAQNMQR